MKLSLRLIIASCVVVPTLLLGGAAQAKPVTLHLKFAQQGPAKSVITNGRYVLVEPPAGAAPTLIDEQTGKRVTLPACANPSLGFVAPYLEWSNCSPPNSDQTGSSQGALVLYTLRTGAITTIGSDQPCDVLEEPCPVYGPAGTDWYAITYNDMCGCTPGQLVSRRGRVHNGPFPPGPREVVDYDALNLGHRLCEPLPLSVKMGRGRSETVNWFFGGDYGFEGSGIAGGPLPVDVIQNSGAWLGGFLVAYDERGDPFLEHCGTRLARRLSTNIFTGNLSALILLGNAPEGRTALRGLFLPSLRRFTIPLPAPLQAPGTQFVLSRRRLWAVTPDGTAWTARVSRAAERRR